MPSPATLALFSAAVLLLLLSPGPNMAFVLLHGVHYGRRGALHVALGIGIADLVLTGLTASGLGLFFAQTPAAQGLLRLAGAAYLFYLAWRALTPKHLPFLQRQALVAAHTLWRRACLNSLLNPKALLFFALFLPQFLEAGRGPASMQLVALGAWLTVLSVLFHGLLGAAGSVLQPWIAPNGHGRASVAWITALVLSLLGLRLLIQG